MIGMRSVLPRFPIYIISKGRSETIALHTAGFLSVDHVPYRVVIEPQEFDDYAKVLPEDKLLVTPFSNLGQGSIPARNFVWQHALSEGHEWHWILDDNIRRIYRLWKGDRIPCDAAPAFRQVEDFTLRFKNVALSGMNYKMFGLPNLTPYFVNTHVYSCILIRNDLPFRWRGRYNEDTDLCLQALTSKWCTLLINVFLADKLPTMTMKGGNTDELYKDDGRLEMAKALQRLWGDDLVEIKRMWQRPQHVVQWKRFRTSLELDERIDLSAFPEVDEYGLKLIAWTTPKAERVQKVLSAYQEAQPSLSAASPGYTSGQG